MSCGRLLPLREREKTPEKMIMDLFSAEEGVYFPLSEQLFCGSGGAGRTSDCNAEGDGKKGERRT